MEIKTTSREVMIEDSKRELRKFERGIKTGLWKDQGYTEQEIKDHLDFHLKDVAYTKKEISYSEYREAYLKIYRKRVV